MDKKLDLAWVAKAIGEEIGLTEPQAHYALKAGLICWPDTSARSGSPTGGNCG